MAGQQQQSMVTKVKNIIAQERLELINSVDNDWTLDKKLYDRINTITDLTSSITSYETLAKSPPSNTFTQNPEEFIAKYILKKRAALVYMCMLYIQKLRDSKKREDEEKKKLAEIVDKLNKLKQVVKNAQGSSSPQINIANFNNATPETISSGIDSIQNDLIALLDEMKKRAEESNNLLNDIIPFIAKQSQLGEFS